MSLTGLQAVLSISPPPSPPSPGPRRAVPAVPAVPGVGVVPQSEAPPVRPPVRPAHRDGVAGSEVGDSEGGEREGEAGEQEVSAALCWTRPDIDQLHTDQTGVVTAPPSDKENIEQI